MAFPSVADADTKSGTVVVNSTSWTLTYPTNIAANDLLIAWLATDGSQAGGPGTWPAGWAPTRQSTSPVSLIVAKKKATGSETGTFNVTGLSSEQGGWRVFRITAASWEGTLGADWGSGSVLVAFTGAGADANPDPSAFAAEATWGVIEDVLFMAAAAVDTSRTFSGFPASYTNTSSDVSGGAGGASLGLARRGNAVSAEDPGSFTISASDDWVCGTLAIRPAVAATYGFPFPRRERQIVPLI